jgi:hypothetical protein
MDTPDVPLSDERAGELVSQLQAALAPPDVPEPLLDAARQALSWRGVDAELATLTGTAPLAGVRAGTTAPALAFDDPAGRHIEIELHPGDRGSIAVGQVVPAASGTVAWQSREETGPPVTLDPGGLFELTSLPSGPVRFVLAIEGGGPVHTDWVTV